MIFLNISSLGLLWCAWLLKDSFIFKLEVKPYVFIIIIIYTAFLD